MYVCACRSFLPHIRLAYSKIEQAVTPEQISHGILRETILHAGLRSHLDVATTGEIPAGSGLGSSSSLAVGMVVALYNLRGWAIEREKAAALACEIEIKRLGKPIGKQDQYAAAYGGINLIRFYADERVEVLPVKATLARVMDFQKHILLFYTGRSREAENILRAQDQDMDRTAPVRRAMRAQAEDLYELFNHSGNWEEFGAILNDGWALKRSLYSQISLPLVDVWYERARQAGAWGGKLLGAGGGGFLLLMAPMEKHEPIRKALNRPLEHPFSIAMQGAHAVYAVTATQRRRSLSHADAGPFL